ncbi:MAG: ferritin-like domain-containing protein [Ginsengibacter sp.]|jgi:ferritin-like metal-binding protein YciE
MKSGNSTGTSTKSKGASKGTSKTTTTTKKTNKSNSAEATGLRELLEDEMKDIYWAEKALLKALPKMAKKATSPDLKDALESHLKETQNHVARCEQVFEKLGKPVRAKKCEAMDGLLKEGTEIMESTEEGVVRDAGIILASQKVEHYEIATYGTLTEFAKTLGENEVADLLYATLTEEKAADEKLTKVAETCINVEAAEAGEEE